MNPSQPPKLVKGSESRNNCVVCSKTLIGEVTVYLRVSMPLSGSALEGSMHVPCAITALNTLPKPAPPKEPSRILLP